MIPAVPDKPVYVVERRQDGSWAVLSILVVLGSEQAADLYLKRLLGVQDADVKPPSARGGQRGRPKSQTFAQPHDLRRVTEP